MCWNTRSYGGILTFWLLLLGDYLGWEVENSTGGPQPYQPYEAEERHSLSNLHRRPFNLENYYYEANVPAFFQQQNMSFVSNSIEDKSSSCQAIDEFQDPDFPFHMTPSRVTTRTALRWS